MDDILPFGDVLDAIDMLSLEEQRTLVDIVQHRMAERSRKLLVAEAREAEQEFATGRCQAATAEELMKEILS
ncbi:MAG: hypothetical protein HOP18_06315 [Deltaproteobacteria bacterium]|nr:hypothetical protein [Deltaproteobacteria bacterium]